MWENKKSQFIYCFDPGGVLSLKSVLWLTLIYVFENLLNFY